MASYEFAKLIEKTKFIIYVW